MTKRRRTILLATILLGTGLLWLLLTRESIQEGRCTLRQRAMGNPAKNSVAELAWQLLEPQPSQLPEIKDLPRGFSPSCFYRIEIDGERLPCALDLSHGKLCMDTDRDGLLSDEQHFQAKSVRLVPRDGPRRRFGPIRVSLHRGGSPEHVVFWALHQAADRPSPLSIYPAHYRSGNLRIDGRVYSVAVVDGDYDGRFNSVLSLPLDRPWRLPACDVFAIDLNRNGEFETALYPLPEVRPLGRLVQIANTCYAVDIAANGSNLSLSRTEPQCGTLAIEPNDASVELRLWSDAMEQHLSQGREWQVPAGKYRAIGAAVSRADESGTVWRLVSINSSASSRLGSLEFFTVEPGKTTSIRIGPPFIVRADVRMAGSGTVSIGSMLVGCTGEEYSAGVQRGQYYPSPPAFKIVDEKGTVLIADKFQYG